MNVCFLCEQSELKTILDLGLSPVANNLEREQSISIKSKKEPLILSQCSGDCGHVQIRDHINQELIFQDYLYTSSVSSTLSKHLSKIATEINKKFGINKEQFIVDIGSNDGTFLNSVKLYTDKFLGVDPASNLSKLANEKNLETLNEFFTENIANRILQDKGSADFIVSTNTYAHTPKIRDFTKGLKVLLSEKGVIIIEVHYLGSMIESNSFDTIYHEHFSYWSLSSLIKIFSDFDLTIFDVEILPIHHGQIRIFASHNGKYNVKDSVTNLLDKENNQGIKSESLTLFSKKSVEIKEKINKMVREIKSKGGSISGYGAPAKAVTMLSFLEIDDSTIPVIYDKSQLKQNMFIPGTSINIQDPKYLKSNNPDYIFLFSWNFSTEIINELQNVYGFSGKVIIPIPELIIKSVNE